MGYKTYTCSIARTCGGCEWLAVPYPIQLQRKQEWVESIFSDAIRQDGSLLRKIVGMPSEPKQYRNKAITPFAPGSHHHIRYGFYARGTHHIVPCSYCLVENPQARKILTKVAKTAENIGLDAYDEDRRTGILRYAIVRTGWKTNESLLTIVSSRRDIPKIKEFSHALHTICPEITSAVQNVNSRHTNAILGRESHILWGSGVMHDKLLGNVFEIGPQSFYQTNPIQTENLYRLAIEDVKEKNNTRILDAYCGTGTIGLCIANHARDQGKKVQIVGIEQVADAVFCAQRNAVANNLQTSCRFVRADATAYVDEVCRGGKANHYDTVVLDPPRSGSTEAFMKGICKLAPNRIIYISCNPTTQIRDLDVLRYGGHYRLARITPVDMFPHTKHVECVALLVRNHS